MDEEADCRARACKPVAHSLVHRQHRLLTGKRLAENIGEEAGCRLVGFARADADRRQPDADAVENIEPRIVGEKQLADRLLRAVARQRRGEELVADLIRERLPENGDL
jgi:hypothetical protein